MLKFFKRKNKKQDEIIPKMPVMEDGVTVNLSYEDLEDLQNVKSDENVFPIIEENFAINTVAMSHIGTRKYQQDAFYVSPPTNENSALAVLCDGMGGMDSGELASAEIIQHYAKFLHDFEQYEDIPQLLLKATYTANDIMHEKFVSQGQAAGTTLVCACIKEDKLYWVSVGDSRIYLVRDKELARLTKDHNYALQLQQQVQNGEISQQAADNNPQKEALVSYLGAPTLEMIDLSNAPFKLMQNDVILLCSDGVTKSLSDEDILNILSEPLTLKENIHRLVISAVDAGFNSQDNTTAVLMKYNGNQ